MPRRYACFFLEFFHEIEVVVKAHCLADGCQGQIGGEEELFCPFHPEAVSGSFFYGGGFVEHIAHGEGGGLSPQGCGDFRQGVGEGGIGLSKLVKAIEILLPCPDGSAQQLVAVDEVVEPERGRDVEEHAQIRCQQFFQEVIEGFWGVQGLIQFGKEFVCQGSLIASGGKRNSVRPEPDTDQPVGIFLCAGQGECILEH